jgi:A/G-specific adenine glycosylase
MWFAQQILTWYDQFGRHDLPWQLKPTPYCIWISEIMLQQTQVQTMVPYFQRFMRAFPTLKALANASLDQVLSLWAGLGYYARARHLHRAAQQMLELHQGQVPNTLAALNALPGIGRSTAGAILAQAYQIRAPILDGNVKRVLTRFHALAGWPGTSAIEQQLWQWSEAYTPQQRVKDYTQGIMDLGATLCRRAQPDCAPCPLRQRCQAYRLQSQTLFPTPKPKHYKPTVEKYLMLIVNAQQQLLLTQRPLTGIWGGLWTVPECELTQSPIQWAQQHLKLQLQSRHCGPLQRHTFTHFYLDFKPFTAQCLNPNAPFPSAYRWVTLCQVKTLGLPAPIKALLTQLRQHLEQYHATHDLVLEA